MTSAKSAKSGTIDFDKDFVEITDPLNRSCGKKIFVAQDKYKAFNAIMNSRNKSFNNLYIYKQLASLKGTGIFNSMFSRYNVLSRMLPIEGGQIIYCIWHGRVYITDIKIQLDFKYTKGIKNIPAGLYRVKKDVEIKGEWSPCFDNNQIKQIDQLRTRHLAVNGHCEDIVDAARYMPAFIQYGHGETTLKDVYSLFFNPSQGFIRGDWRALRDS